MIALRLDGGKIIGMGHAMRCLSLAKALRAAGEDCCFITADDAVGSFITEAGFAWHNLHGTYGKMDEELSALLPLLKKLAPKFVLADSYAVTEHWMCAVDAVAPLFFMDDEDMFLYPVRVLINYNLSSENRNYPEEYAGTATKLLLGPQYAPLRTLYAGLPPHTVNEKAQNVMVSTGGADPLNVACTLMREVAAAPQWRGVTFHFLVGALNPNRPSLEAEAAALSNVKLYSHLPDLKTMMQRCDVAISAAGSTLYELCACGTPTVTYTLADNQLPGATAFAAHNLMLSAGDCRDNPAFGLSVGDCLTTLCSDSALRAKQSCAMQRMIDGNGATRLATALLALC